ncbi:MAG: hypothetical protein AB7S44_01765 [Spirochaetales bacterium]
MGSLTVYILVTVLVFLTIAVPLIIYIARQVKLYKIVKSEDSDAYLNETDEEFAARINKEIMEKLAKKKNQNKSR